MSKFTEKTITILGDGGVGKTSLVHALKINQPLSLEKIQKTAFLEVDDLFFEEFKIICYDLPGQESTTHPINVLPDTIFKDTNLILLAFSLDRFNSLMNLESWLLQVRNYYNNNYIPIPVIMLLGTKADLRKRIDEKLIENIIINVPEIVDYVKVSAITYEGLDVLRSKILYHLGLNLDQKAAPTEEFYKTKNVQTQKSFEDNNSLQSLYVSEKERSSGENASTVDTAIFESSLPLSSSKLETNTLQQGSNTDITQVKHLELLSSTNKNVNAIEDSSHITKTIEQSDSSSNKIDI